MVDEHSSSEEMPYKFNGKEFDEETGLYYYGARYMNPVASVWYGVDPHAEKMPQFGAYSYCFASPIKLIDFYGEEPTDAEAALMSKHSYGGKDAAETKADLKKTGWKESNEVEGLCPNWEAKTDQYGRITSYGGFKAQLYERTVGKKKEFCYAYAGSDDMQDFFDDAVQYFGFTPAQYKTAVNNAKKIVSQLQEKYGKDVSITFVGHSLGGGEAAAASMATGMKAITFNPAAVVSQKLMGNESHITNYIATGEKIFSFGNYDIFFGGDVLHNFQLNTGTKTPGKIVYLRMGTGITHSINDFYNFFYKR